MGMDLTGKNPTNKRGEYFRANCWYWRPLWDYVCQMAHIDPKIQKAGHYNDGAGLDAEESERVAEILHGLTASGEVKATEKAYIDRMNSLPLEKCKYCHGGGIRHDLGTKTLCNVCSGAGKVKQSDTWYVFDADFVKEFADFLDSCGGFEIY